LRAFLLTLCLAFVSPSAFAYLPPAFFLYSKLAEQKTKVPVTGVALTVARPQGSGTEEILGTLTISGWAPTPGGWPGLSLLFHADAAGIIEAVTDFGLTVTPETDLMRVDHAKLQAMKEPPTPFYKTDPTMSLKRTRQTYAWVHSNPQAGLSIWIEKDSFLPLKVAAPCPAAAAALGWAKAGDNKCELEFRNLYALRHGNFQNARMILWKDGAPLLFLTFDRLGTAKTKLPPSDGKLPAEVKEIVETVLH
jgi:hypothetical protein